MSRLCVCASQPLPVGWGKRNGGGLGAHAMLCWLFICYTEGEIDAALFLTPSPGCVSKSMILSWHSHCRPPHTATLSLLRPFCPPLLTSFRPSPLRSLTRYARTLSRYNQ